MSAKHDRGECGLVLFRVRSEKGFACEQEKYFNELKILFQAVKIEFLHVEIELLALK